MNNNGILRRRRLFFLLLLVSIFLLNDFLFIIAKGYVAWLLIDYGSRILAIAVILYLIRHNISALPDFGLVRITIRQGIAWAALLSVTGILIDQIGWRFFKKALPATQLMSFPSVNNIYVDMFDLTIGIVLISVSEELIFRGYFYSVVRKYVQSTAWMVLLSCLVFGLIHWSMGLHAIVTTALWGILPMVVMMRTGSVVPALIAHYLTDLVSLSNIMPARWFDFLL